MQNIKKAVLTALTRTTGSAAAAVRLAVLTSVAAGVLAVPSAAQAVTATVPNHFYCSAVTNKCVQTNGAYDRRYPTVCRTVFYAIWGGNRSPVLCDRWY